MFIEELAAKLVADEVGVLQETIFLSTKPTRPPVTAPGPEGAVGPKTIVIVDTGGIARARRQREEYERPSASITACAPTGPEALALIRAAFDSIGGLHNVVLSGTRYLWCRAKQGPTDIGPDGKGGYPQYVFNVEAMKDPS